MHDRSKKYMKFFGKLKPCNIFFLLKKHCKPLGICNLSVIKMFTMGKNIRSSSPLHAKAQKCRRIQILNFEYLVFKIVAIKLSTCHVIRAIIWARNSIFMQ